MIDLSVRFVWTLIIVSKANKQNQYPWGVHARRKSTHDCFGLACFISETFKVVLVRVC